MTLGVFSFPGIARVSHQGTRDTECVCVFVLRSCFVVFSTLALSYFLYSSMNSTMYPFPYGYALIAGAQSLPRLEPRSAGVHVPHASRSSVDRLHSRTVARANK